MNRHDEYEEYDEAQDDQWQHEENPANKYQPYEDGQVQEYDPLLYPEEGYEEQQNEQPYGEMPEERYAPSYIERVRSSRAARQPRKPQMISTNATINLTCTICAGCGLFGLFLFFADQRSRAVRRFAVQSAGLLCVSAFLCAGLAVLATLFAYIPFIGGMMSVIVWLLLAALLCWVAYQRVQLMSHAYRGEAYVLPFIGNQCRQFE